MKKAIAFILVFISTLSLFACKKNDAPKGMQLARGSEYMGYCFYVPEEWTVSNLPGISTSYVSTITSTSVSFAEINATEFEYNPDEISAKDYFLTKYFYKAAEQFPTAPTSVSKNEDGSYPPIAAENCSEVSEYQDAEHRADAAKKYVFQYKYQSGENIYTYRFTQIYIVKGERYYIIQYFGTAEKFELDGTKIEKFQNQYENDTYIEKFYECVKNLKFFSTPAKNPQVNEGHPAEFAVVSDKKLAGFIMEAPTTFKVDISNAVVSLTASDGANVTVTKAVGLNQNANDYMMQRKEELLQIVTDFEWITEYAKDENGEIVLDDNDNPVLSYNEHALGNLPKRDNQYNWSLVFEYTYTYGGERYRVLQILATDVSAADLVLSQAKGYVFTYTAKESIYAQHKAEVDEMIKRIEF